MTAKSTHLDPLEHELDQIQAKVIELYQRIFNRDSYFFGRQSLVEYWASLRLILGNKKPGSNHLAVSLYRIQLTPIELRMATLLRNKLNLPKACRFEMARACNDLIKYLDQEQNLSDEKVIASLDDFQKTLKSIEKRYNKISGLDVLTTTIGGFGGFIAGCFMAPFMPFAMAYMVGQHYMNSSGKNSIRMAIGTGILGFFAGVALGICMPFLGASLPVLQKTLIPEMIFKKIYEEINIFQDKVRDYSSPALK